VGGDSAVPASGWVVLGGGEGASGEVALVVVVQVGIGKARR